MAEDLEVRETRATGSFDERDNLTGLRAYYSLLNNIKKFRGDDVYVVLCDVDNFRLINEAYGENVCDGLLASIGKTIQKGFGDRRTFRYGSDEFLIVNSFFDEEAFLEKLSTLDRQLAQIAIDGRELRITCSYGYAHGKIETVEDIHEAVRLADRKMYEAKRLGKGRAVGMSLGVDPLLHANSRAHGYKSYESDELTGLANLIYFRSALDDVLSNLVKEDQAAVEHGLPVASTARPAIVYFNVENFKSFNQSFGFDQGDELLLKISEIISDNFPHDVAARFSADQFYVMAELGHVEPGIRAVRQAFRKIIKDGNIWLKAGYYVIAPGDEDAGVACDRAKIACDSIHGRRDVFFRRYDEELQNQIVLHHYVLEHFEQALEEGWVRPYYQPIIRVATGEICDVEALARWVDPDEDLINPVEFVPALEQARLIHRLDLAILRDVCRDCRSLIDRGIAFIPPSINISRLDFELCDIVAEVKAVLDEFEMPYDSISVEVTESALTGSRDFLKDEVDRFREAGFDVWIDDFGSGYSSLNTLKDYNFDLMKIDMGFLDGFETTEEARILLAHIINLAKDLGLRTLCEGVETQEQLDFLRSLGLGRAQGFLIGRPLSMEDAIEAVRSGDWPPVEERFKREFYETVGHVNLMRPDPQPSTTGHYLPSDVAAAIIRRKKGHFEYLNTNDLYMKFLNDTHIDTVQASEAMINDPESERGRLFARAISLCEKTDTWHHYTLEVGHQTMHVRLKKVAEFEPTDSIAVIAIVEYGQVVLIDDEQDV